MAFMDINCSLAVDSSEELYVTSEFRGLKIIDNSAL